MSQTKEYKHIKIIAFLFFLFFIKANAQLVSTLAGSTQGFADGTGNAAQFLRPAGIAVDSDGNIYVADDDNHRIRKITPVGVVSTLAGSGIQGYADGTGTIAQFNSPLGVAVDDAGNVYVADGDNNRIRKVTSTGVVSTFAGSGDSGFADGNGSVASFSDPYGVAVDGLGNIYVADTFNHRIRKITPEGVVTTLAGSTEGYVDGVGTMAKFFRPFSLTVDSSGTVYVADTGNNLIRKITASGIVTTLAGSTQGFSEGIGTNAQFNNPCGIYVNTTGTVFVGDLQNNRIREITPDGLVSTFAGSTQGYMDGQVDEAQFFWPWGLTVDSEGTMFVAEYRNHLIRKITNTLGTIDYHQNQVSVYPNPATSIINIELKIISNTLVIIYDMQGRVLLSEYIFDKKVSVPINNLSKGVYLIQVTTQNSKVSRKFVKR